MWFAHAYYGVNFPFKPSITMELHSRCLSLTASGKRSRVDAGHFHFPPVWPSRSELCLWRRSHQTQSCQPSWSCRLQPGEKLPVVFFCCLTNRPQRIVCVWVQVRQVRTPQPTPAAFVLPFAGEENDHKKRQRNFCKILSNSGWLVDLCMCIKEFLCSALIAV